MSGDERRRIAEMPVTNGELHLPPTDVPALSTSGKRKRISSPDGKIAEDSSLSNSASQQKHELDQTLRYLLQILNEDDTDLHLLNTPITSSSLTKPHSKRAKLSEHADRTTTIEARVAAGRYTSIQEFLDDVEKASSVIVDRRGPQADQLENQSDPEATSELSNRITAFKKHLNGLLLQTSFYGESIIKSEQSEPRDVSEEPHISSDAYREDKMVLTLFGNASNPKHLFSSLQQPIKVPLQTDTPRYVELQPLLRENALPNGISATRVVPFNLKNTDEAGPASTFGEIFASRPSLPQLEPPRRARSWPRDPSSMWLDPFEAATSRRSYSSEKSNYCFAPLPSTHWLQYGGVTSSPSYWSRKQKQLSSIGNEIKDIPYKWPEIPSLVPDEDTALLRSVYSSFAPSFDSSGSIVQADSKHMVWWAKRGAKRFQTLMSLQCPAGDSEENTQDPTNAHVDDLDDANPLEETVKSYNPEDSDLEVPSTTESDGDVSCKDMDEVLRDISDLLETLNSYRQISNLDISTAGIQNSESKEPSTDIGTPSSPSSAEMSIYETLRASLAAIIANLPPYTVSKLNGEQLAELNISQRIVVENPDYSGTMEEDDFTIQQKRLATVTPASRGVTPVLPSSRPGGLQPSQTPVTGYNQRVYPNSRGPQPSSGYQNSQQYYGSRQPSTPGPYTPGNTQNFGGSRPQASPSARSNYLPSYSQSTSQYNSAGPAQQFQRPTQNGYSYTATQGQASAQASQQSYAQRPTPTSLQQPTPYSAGRSASPQKQPGYGTPQPRPSYLNPGSATPQRFYPQQQPTPYGNLSNSQTPSASTSYSNSAATATYARSAAEQAALMDRNKVQISVNRRQSSSNLSSSVSQPQLQPPKSRDQGNSQERSVSPRNKQNGAPVSTVVGQ